MIASLRRTGSSMLGRALGMTGELGHPAEYLNHEAMTKRRRSWGAPRISPAGHVRRAAKLVGRDPKWWVTDRFTSGSLERYLDSIPRRRSTANGVFSIKVHWDDFDRALLQRGHDEGRWGVPVVWVRLTRDDHLRQAVSLARARQTDRWGARAEERRTPVYDRDAISRALDEIERDETSWVQYLERVRATPVHVRYEELVTAYQPTMRALLDSLGCSHVAVPDMPGGRMADERSDDWVGRFTAETGRS